MSDNERRTLWQPGTLTSAATPVAHQVSRREMLEPQASRAIFRSMTRQQVLDLYFMDARSKLLDLAAFLDRVERASGPDDFRIEAFRRALSSLNKSGDRVEQVLLEFSDPTTEPIASATTKAACGAWPGAQ